MKIVLDMNISSIWVPFLIDAGYEAIHWSKVGDICAEDSKIMHWAKANQDPSAKLEIDNECCWSDVFCQEMMKESHWSRDESQSILIF